ncbi:Permease of the drug/metabolite transporter (DMT) superfamily [hydrothermal vent metagenome]|uniref:Permease of the drug/metabolite transporter (DMT) superfamily n=1 Tax=hydrothermal vent metagenome TaxID=652676 RepID=A0A3B0Y5F6_9ZZZZ
MAYVKDSIRSFLVQIVVLSAGLAGGIINARWLGPEGVGIYVLLGLIPALCFRFGNLGFGSGFSFFLAKKKLALASATRIMLALSLGLALIFGALLTLIWSEPFLPWHDVPVALLYTALALVPLAFMQNYAQRILSGCLRIKEVNISELCGTFTYLAMLVLFVIYLGYGVKGALAALLVSKITIVLFLLSRIYGGSLNTVASESDTTEHSSVTKIWRYGRWNYLILLNRFLVDWFPVLVLKYVSGNESVGLYSVARTIGDRLQTVPNAFSSVIFPYNANSDLEQAKSRTNTTTRIFLFLMTLMAIVLGAMSKFLILLLYGAEYEKSIQAFYLLLPVIVFFPLYKFQNVHISATGKSKMASSVSLIVLPFSILLCMSLIPSFGLLGASAAISTTYIALAALNFMLYRKYTCSGLKEMLVINANDIRKLKGSLDSMLKKPLSS